jgi:hypothetical protein
LPTYGVGIETVRTLLQQANVVALGDRFLIEAEEQKVVELAAAMEELRRRPSLIAEVWMVDVAEGCVDRLIDPASGNYTLLGSFTRKTTERSRQGMPLLMEIPGVRSLVSKATTNTVHRSLMILIKPVGGVTVPE